MKYSYLGPDGFGTYEIDWDSDPSFRRVDALPEALLIPGFVDIHIHGADGIDFMSASEAELQGLCDSLRERGYEAFLPTTVTAPPAAVKRAIANLPDDPMIAGFHLEGPFISPEYPGAQPPAYISGAREMNPDWEDILSDPRLKIVTLAPEVPGALPLIERLASAGVIVSLGHTNATYEQCRLAVDEGARHSTHTFNAMRPFHHREAGAAGFALTEDELTAELIYDRVHVSHEAADLLVKCKPEDNIVAVSDSTMATGLAPGTEVEMWGHAGVVSDRDVRLKTGALAGSTITLLDAFRNLAEDFGLELAIRACCINPRRALNLGQAPDVYIELNRSLDILNIRRT